MTDEVKQEQPAVVIKSETKSEPPVSMWIWFLGICLLSAITTLVFVLLRHGRLLEASIELPR